MLCSTDFTFYQHISLASGGVFEFHRITSGHPLAFSNRGCPVAPSDCAPVGWRFSITRLSPAGCVSRVACQRVQVPPSAVRHRRRRRGTLSSMSAAVGGGRWAVGGRWGGGAGGGRLAVGGG